MFGFLKFARKKRMDFASKALRAPSEASEFGLVQLKILQMVTQQVVLSLESSVRLPGANKKAMAIELVGKILEEMNLVAPDSLVDTMWPFGSAYACESAVSILKALDKVQEKSKTPSFSLDISGRPKSGN